MNLVLLLLAEEVLQLYERDVVALPHLAPQDAPLPLREARRLTASMRQGLEVAGGAPLPKHLLDEGGADAELLGDFRKRVPAMFVGVDDALS